MKCAQNFFLFLCAAALLSATQITASAADLTEDQSRAAQRITEGSVLSTVSFLASDEMAGRDTPSPQLRIASAYVAARFRGAGLETLDAESGYFQTHSFQVTQPPAGEILLRTADGQQIRTAGILCGGPDDIDVTARVPEHDAALSDQTSGIAIIEEMKVPPGMVSRPSHVIASLRRRVHPLAEQGVKVVLMKCAAQSVLKDVAAALQNKAVKYQETLQPECCVILINDSEETAGREITVKVDAQRVEETPVRNVVGIVRGTDPELASQAVIVSAHLDHIGTRPRGEDTINNGADDNASGVTAVLTLADAFGALNPPPRRSMIFVTFWGEEKGLLGSKAFVKQPPWPLDDVVANVNIEMIGRPEKDAREKIWMTGWKHSNLGDVMKAGADRVGVEIFDRKDVGEMLYKRSDNYSFVQMGVVAHSFSAGSLHSDYHQPTDEWTKLDIPHATKVIQGLFAGTLHIADSDIEVRPLP